MEQRVKDALDGFEAREAAETQVISGLALPDYLKRRDEFLISVGHEAGELINLLAKGVNARRILELGTSYGYSTLWLAEAASCTNGTVVTTELVPEKLAHAREVVAGAGLDGRVEFRLGDARDIVDSLEGFVDFVLLDLWKETYVECFDRLYSKLSPGALIVADNMLRPERHRPAAEQYRAHVRSKRGMTSVLLPVGNGLELSRYD